MERIGLVVVALVVEVGAASASPCGGSSNDASDWSSFDDDDDATSATPSRSLGSGPPPLLHLELGFAVRQLASPLGARSGSLSHEGEAFSYRVVNNRTHALDTALAAQARIGVPLRYGFYAAVEGELGGLTDHATSTEMTTSGTRGTPTIDQTSVTLFGAALVLGVGTQVGRLNLGVEAAGGFHALAYGQASTYGACETSSAVIASGGVLEGRARAAYWASPHVTVGLTAGKSMLELREPQWMAGVYVGWHTTAFGR